MKITETFNGDKYDFSEEIARGAALLDQIAPGWEEKIRTQDLNLASSHGCVLGQTVLMRMVADSSSLPTGYYGLADRLWDQHRALLGDFADKDDAMQGHGFWLNDPHGRHSVYDQLTVQWVGYIKNRLAETDRVAVEQAVVDEAVLAVMNVSIEDAPELSKITVPA